MSKNTESTVFDFEEEPASGTFYLKDGGMQGEGWVKLRLLTTTERKGFWKQCHSVDTKYVKVEGTPFRDDRENIDNDKWNRLFWGSVIVGWGNIMDRKQGEIACTPENIEKVLLVPRFAKFINDCLAQLEKQALADKEAQTEN